MPTSSVLPPVVVKLGGSLLRREDWPGLLRRWLTSRPPSRCLIICGGGERVDQLRLRDQALSLGDAACHWMAIAEMSRNTAEAAAKFPYSKVCACLHQVEQAFQVIESSAAGDPRRGLAGMPGGASRVVFFDCQPFLQQETPWRGLSPLPQSWDVSSDSIAARIALRWQSAPLVLLKSASPDVAAGRQLCLRLLARQGYVDAYFPEAAAGLAGAMVNLADPAAVSFAWEGRGAAAPPSRPAEFEKKAPATS